MLKNAYDYLLSQGYELGFEYNSNVAISYDNDLEMELREDLVYYGFDKPCRLYFTDYNGVMVFNEYAIIREDNYVVNQDYIVCTLMDCLRVTTLQNDLFDRTLEEIDKANGF